MTFSRKLIAGLAITALLSLTAEAALAASSKRIIRISGNSGGRIGDFIVKMSEYRSTRASVNFSGRCDSACTLLLALPRSQICVSPGAYFRFHAPSAGSARTAMKAKAFMMGRYPGWVRSWIRSRKGLTSQLATMDYSYASRFLPRCSQKA